METKSERPNEPAGSLSSLDMAIDTLDLAKVKTSVRPAKCAFGSPSVLLTAIRVRFLPAHVGRLLTDLLRIR